MPLSNVHPAGKPNSSVNHQNLSMRPQVMDIIRHKAKAGINRAYRTRSLRSVGMMEGIE